MFLLAGCSEEHFPSYIQDQDYADGHPLALNQSVLPDYELRLVELVNEARREAGLKELEYLPSLSAVARAHSAHMPIHYFYDHVNPEGDGPGVRLSRVAGGWTVSAENIHMVNEGTPPESVFTDFMASPDHRDNILSPLVNGIGVGVALGRNYLLSTQPSIYVTMDFIWKQ